MLIEDSENKTVENKKLDLIIALSYGGRNEITEAAKRLAEKVKNGIIHPNQISEKLFARQLYTPDIPDPDLLIRTSGEKRLSNFLLWQIAYSELVFIDTLWPDFSESDFLSALAEFEGRERRYGAVIS
jgi:undecaprenyl diphosphate synthase